ncbi:MAG: response regulator transcription factor [Acidimicrobiales bacterium]
MEEDPLIDVTHVLRMEVGPAAVRRVADARAPRTPGTKEGSGGSLGSSVDPKKYTRGDVVRLRELLCSIRHPSVVIVGAVVRPSTASDGALSLEECSAREIDVLRLVGAGATNSEVAAQLYISDATVRSHVGRLRAKLRARNRVELVVLAHRLGLVNP